LPAAIMAAGTGAALVVTVTQQRDDLGAHVKGGVKVDHWGGAKGYQQRER
jgi:hypothetical protein